LPVKVEALVKEMMALKLYTMEAGSRAIESLAYVGGSFFFP